MSIYPDWLGVSVIDHSGISINAVAIVIDETTDKSRLDDIPKEHAPRKITGVVDSVTTVTPSIQPEISVVVGDQKRILPHQPMGGISIPIMDQPTNSNDCGAGIVVLPLIGGGRGPVINEGETITTSLLLELLGDAVSKNELSADLRAELDAIPLAIPNNKAQSGYATHNDTIILDHDWSGYPPVIELSPSHGTPVGLVLTHVGIEPDCLTYVEVREQELVYGHSGVVNDNQFTVKAAILEKVDPTIVLLDWSSGNITGPPLVVESAVSPVTETTVDCMGLRIKGTLNISNGLSYEVSGAMSLQISVDNGPWVDVARLYWHFAADNPDSIAEKFDVLMAYDHGSHNYQFRGRLVTDSDDEPNRELTGSVYVDTVTEFGAGSVITNDLQIKWASKE